MEKVVYAVLGFRVSSGGSGLGFEGAGSGSRIRVPGVEGCMSWLRVSELGFAHFVRGVGGRVGRLAFARLGRGIVPVTQTGIACSFDRERARERGDNHVQWSLSAVGCSGHVLAEMSTCRHFCVCVPVLRWQVAGLLVVLC